MFSIIVQVSFKKWGSKTGFWHNQKPRLLKGEVCCVERANPNLREEDALKIQIPIWLALDISFEITICFVLCFVLSIYTLIYVYETFYHRLNIDLSSVTLNFTFEEDKKLTSKLFQQNNFILRLLVSPSHHKSSFIVFYVHIFFCDRLNVYI